jgi:hypothetical protein
MRLAVWLLAIKFIGIVAPLVLLTGRLFSGPHDAPTLECHQRRSQASALGY